MSDKLYEIPTKIEKDLSQLIPYEGSEDITDPEEYLINYIAIGSPTTYYNDGRCQCISGRNRSFLDLYFLTKAKFTELTLEEFAKLFLTFHNKQIIPKYGRSIYTLILFCGDIHKIVLYLANQEHFAIGLSCKGVIDDIIEGKYDFTDITLLEILDLAGLDYYHFVK